MRSHSSELVMHGIGQAATHMIVAAIMNQAGVYKKHLDWAAVVHVVSAILCILLVASQATS